MQGLGGLGVTCSPPFTYHPDSNTCDCAYGTTYNPSRDTCEGTPTGGGGSGSSSGGINWGSLLTSVTTGLVKGLTDDTPAGGPPPGYTPPPPPPAPAWYMTPTGMIGIGAGALVLFLMLRK